MPIRLDDKLGKDRLDPIVLPEIKKMIKNYRSAPNFDDTKSGWVSAYELMDLIADNKANGVRFYFARHGADAPSDIAGKLTIVLVATRDEATPGNPTTENSRNLLKAKEDANGPASSLTANIIIKNPTLEGEDDDYTNVGGDAIPLCPKHCPPDPDPVDLP